jgi:nicotinamidase-related amidase
MAGTHAQPKSGVADALIVIDMQKGFLRRQPDLERTVRNLTALYPDESTYWLVYRNHGESSFVRHLGWGEMMSSPDIDLADTLIADPARTYRHESYSLPKALLERLKGCDVVALAGTDTDACVQAAAFDLWDAGIQPLIVEPCCGSSGGMSFHKAAIDLIRRQFGMQAIVDTIAPRLAKPRGPSEKPATPQI